MTTTQKATFKTIPVGTKVTWHYRSAIGHGTVKGVHKKGTNADNTMRKEMLALLKDDLAKVGIEITLDPVEFNTLVTHTRHDFQYDACLLGLEASPAARLEAQQSHAMGMTNRTADDVWGEIQDICRGFKARNEPIPTLGGKKRPREPVDNRIEDVLPDRIVRMSERVRTEPSVIRKSEVVRVWEQLDSTGSCRGPFHKAFTDALLAHVHGVDNDGRHVTVGPYS